MFKYKVQITWLMLASFVFAMLVPLAPVQAASIADLLGQTSSSGQGLVDLLLGLFLGKFLDKLFNGASRAADKIGLPSGLIHPGAKEIVGFYAEWWSGDKASFNSLSANTDAVKTIAPFWATLQADGSVTDRGGRDHAAVVDFAHRHNISVLLLVNNAKQDNSVNSPIHTVLSDPSLRSKAIDSLEAYIKKFNLDGVNIDFEMVPPEDRENLTAFMKELSARLKPQGYLVTIDVFPKQDEQKDVAYAYDYTALSKYADKIMIMTYDNHGMWSDAGPIADIRWVEQSIQYALQFIPKHKLYLGIATYGYDWSNKGVKSLTYANVMDLVKRYNVVLQWDEPSKSPHFTYTGADGLAHQVWFENSRSLHYKLDLINKYDLAGAALWKLGDEDPNYWSVLKAKLLKQ
ncbi:glycosyl hydrolase family 18 protein [Sporolituus thermophilus]|uniref:Glycosyl hydrolases family 18 n=1 Tax=Sporolituus thermophilus DSM 23256 TaxID=1123285 RepID=A0A1G7I152_9FIRM|nr:glycosyl hydrolase family 18 protein [Sporolituus thermophilus]SDF06303.1 Glycosyl hydrolases family 18 [Sporolituus thermophilus DSM 23256]